MRHTRATILFYARNQVMTLVLYLFHNLNNRTRNVSRRKAFLSRKGLACFDASRCVRGVVDGFATADEVAQMRTLARCLKILYKGIGAGLMRQSVYATARLGLYEVMRDEVQKENEKRCPLTRLFGPGYPPDPGNW